MKMVRRLVSLVFLTFLLPYAMATVHTYQLKNGLKVIVKEDHRSAVAYVSTWYKVGGSYEHNGITGISHVLEHMMFRGSKSYPAGMLEQLVSRVGGQQNAMTSNDFTMYFEMIPANQLPLIFKLEADRMHNLSLTPADFNKEIQVVMEERRMRFDNNPQALTYERFMASAFINSPYHHQTIGWMTDLENMTHHDLIDWYHHWYQPNNAVLVVVGDVNPHEVDQWAEKYFGPIPMKPVPKLKPRKEIPSLGQKRIDVSLPAKLPIIMRGYLVPSLSTMPGSWQPYALDVLATILGGSDSSRFQNQLLRQQRLVSGVEVSYSPFSLHENLLTMMLVPMPGVSAQHLGLALDEAIHTVQTTLVSDDELNRVKAQMTASQVFSHDSLSTQGMLLGQPESIGLSWELAENYVKHINQVTPEQVREVAQRYLIKDRLTVAILHPLNAKPQAANTKG